MIDIGMHKNIGMMTSYDIYPVVFTEGFVFFFPGAMGVKTFPTAQKRGPSWTVEFPKHMG